MKRYIVVVTLVVALVAVAAAFAVMPAQHSSNTQVDGGQLLAVHTFYLGSNYTPPECPLPVGNGCGGW